MQRGALWAFVPVIGMLPFTLLALVVFWFPFSIVFGVDYWMFAVAFLAVGLLMFVRPFQVFVLTPILGARRPTPTEAAVIEPIWTGIAEANGLPASRYVVRVVDTDEVNAFACGGHLVVVTTFAVTELTASQLRGVLAHELSHHLGLHTVAITLGHWLSVPVVVLARIGFYLENVAQAAAGSFGQRSAAIAAVGTRGRGDLQRAGVGVHRGDPRQRRDHEHGRPLVRVRGRPTGGADGLRRRTRRCPALRTGTGLWRATDRVAGTTGRVAPAGTHPRRPHRSPDAPPRPLTSPDPARPRVRP